ncbi:uncharacterized protein LOC106666571 [Cimex lectularius]|uniref:Colmedin n=1 Tax=Cimex lectularius TaxID=79782 RepID=A0A8I6RSJ0_CIMLE|nr:uncharacterized protein LOC106666571 [Cimex lectularius]
MASGASKKEGIKPEAGRISKECKCIGSNLITQKLTYVYICVGLVLVTQIVLYVYLYRYISRVESKLHGELGPVKVRPKRSLGDLENTVLNQESANVEYYSPGGRKDFDDHQYNNTNKTEDWVELSSLSRIPVAAIQEYCLATKKYCPAAEMGPIGPAGEPGPAGEKGPKGDRGERGFKGEMGRRGPEGPPGHPGPKGHIGFKGLKGDTGMDGRDGLPGEPGLDGVSGRNGKDGTPGLPGEPGLNGLPGTPGINGTNGIPGSIGPPGPKGEMGMKGLTGPRGRPGRPGNHGIPGTPGIQAWEVTVNGTRSSELLIPPAIVGSESIFSSGPIVLKEGENVRLMCAATGNPRPVVQWQKMDSPTIGLGKWKDTAIIGSILNITRVNREHMGTYMCLAGNGIPPTANQTFSIEVYFTPLITVSVQNVWVKVNKRATLVCEVEAYPDAVEYWESSDGKLIESSDKYTLAVNETGKYTFTRKGGRRAISYEYTKLIGDGPAPIGTTVVFGQGPPAKADLNDLCPPPVQCPECPDPKEFKCRHGLYSLYELLGNRNIENRSLENKTYPGIPNRALGCQVYAVGKPVFLRSSESHYGSWMRDPVSKSDDEKYWVTEEENNAFLFEFANKTQYRKNIAPKKYSLQYPFSGNSHVIYNGSFFYHYIGKQDIVKYTLATGQVRTLTLPLAKPFGENFLYRTQHNYVDFSVDDNGLWVIYGLIETNNTAVLKIDPETLEIQYGYNISLQHQKAGETFIVCGVLYAVDSTTDRRTTIRFAFDLFKGGLLDDVNLEFTNPFRKTTMIGYDHKHKELYTWDKGNQLTYPIRYHEMSYNSSKEDKGDLEAQPLQSGYEVFPQE